MCLVEIGSLLRTHVVTLAIYVEPHMNAHDVYCSDLIQIYSAVQDQITDYTSDYRLPDQTRLDNACCSAARLSMTVPCNFHCTKEEGSKQSSGKKPHSPMYDCTTRPSGREVSCPSYDNLHRTAVGVHNHALPLPVSCPHNIHHPTRAVKGDWFHATVGGR